MLLCSRVIKRLLQKKLVRYIIVGVTSVGVDYGTLLLSYHILDFSLAAATTIGFLTGLIINFLLNKFWSFKASHTVKNSIRQGVMVSALVVFNLIVTNLVIVYLHKVHVGPEISKLITTAMITLWNYVLYKEHIFKQPEPVV